MPHISKLSPEIFYKVFIKTLKFFILWFLLVSQHFFKYICERSSVQYILMKFMIFFPRSFHDIQVFLQSETILFYHDSLLKSAPFYSSSNFFLKSFSECYFYHGPLTKFVVFFWTIFRWKLLFLTYLLTKFGFFFPHYFDEIYIFSLRPTDEIDFLTLPFAEIQGASDWQNSQWVGSADSPVTYR